MSQKDPWQKGKNIMHDSPQLQLKKPHGLGQWVLSIKASLLHTSALSKAQDKPFSCNNGCEYSLEDELGKLRQIF